MSTEASFRAVEAVVFPSLDLAGEAEGYTRGHAAGYAAGLRRAAVHLLGIGTAAEFAFANHPRRVELVG